jgi:Zn-dependent protease
MLPIPPLDGGRVLSGLLPPRAAMSFDRIEPFGMMIIIALLVSGLLWQIVGPVVRVVLGFFLGIVGM